jgi:putative addiction module component (TIGR02574 family)
MEKVTEEALALPAADRAELADRLVESLDPAEDDRIRQLWLNEARHRIDEVRTGKVQTIPSDKAIAAIRQALVPQPRNIET